MRDLRDLTRVEALELLAGMAAVAWGVYHMLGAGATACTIGGVLIVGVLMRKRAV
jgi:hypothetical protein